MTPDEVERLLSDFRTWLEELSGSPTPIADPPTVDLHTLVAQFTALRHEVNLQTRAARTSLEQTATALQQLGEVIQERQSEPVADDGRLDPFLRAVIDVHDHLTLALRQVTRQRETLEKPLAELSVAPPNTERSGFWPRLFRSTSSDSVAKLDPARRHADAASLVRSALDGLITGYRMSLSRVDRVLEQASLEPIPVVEQTFDPELMEVVDVAMDTGRRPGEVVEEMRRGYRRGETVVRYAQVKVAR